MLKYRLFEIRISNWKSLSAGGGEGIRTPDPRVANAVLCQLSYTPEAFPNWRLPISVAPIGNRQLKISNEFGCGGGI